MTESSGEPRMEHEHRWEVSNLALVKTHGDSAFAALVPVSSGDLVPIEWCVLCGFIRVKVGKPPSPDARILKPEGSQASGSATESDLRDLRTAIAHLTEERNQYRTLAAIGAWHAECRPNREMAARELAKSQAVIDKLADTISHLTEEREGLKEALEAARFELSRTMCHQCGGYLDPVKMRCVECDEEDKRHAGQLAALTEGHERLRKLVVKWRDESMHPGRWYGNPALRGRLSACANEVDALLSPREGTPQEPHE